MTVLDLTSDEYHADLTGDTPTLSSSIAKLLVTKTPAHARAAHPRLNPSYLEKYETKFDRGQAAHAVLLQGVELVDPLPFDSWRTKDSQQARVATRARGRIPMLEKEWQDVKDMVDAARAQLAVLKIHPAPLSNGKPEQTLVWNEDGVRCRARIDWLHSNGLLIDDVKTSSVDFNRWTTKTMWENGYAIQAAWYQRAVQSVYGVTFCDFRFVLIETSPPYALSVIDLAPSAILLANEQIDYALDVWKRCLETDSWPAYPPRVATVEAPAWVETRWYERQAAALEAAA